MKLILKDNIKQKLENEIKLAIQNGFEIEEIQLSSSEIDRLKAELGQLTGEPHGLVVYYYNGYKITEVN